MINEIDSTVTAFAYDADKGTLQNLQTLSTLPADFPYSFKLVAYKDAVIKKFWIDMELLENGRKIASGVTEVNRPFNWNGIDFFNTQISVDGAKRPYAGLQIVRDPGKYVVYAGMIILSAGAVAAWYRRFFRSRT